MPMTADIQTSRTLPQINTFAEDQPVLYIRVFVLLVTCVVLWAYAARTLSRPFFVRLSYAVLYAAVTLGLSAWLAFSLWQLTR